MKTYSLFILFFVIIACKKTIEPSFELNVDPLTNAYKKNNVEYYLRIVSGKDTIYTIDSVCVDLNGLITLKEIKRGYVNKTKTEYDSLNRKVKIEHDSDIHYKFKTQYQLEVKSQDLISHDFIYNRTTKSFDTTPTGITFYKFRNGKLIEDILVSLESKDTMLINHYKYNSNNRIIEIIKKNTDYGCQTKIEYKYRKNNTLSQIIGDGEVKYISEKSGLIDSVKQDYPNERTIYKYYFRKNKLSSK